MSELARKTRKSGWLTLGGLEREDDGESSDELLRVRKSDLALMGIDRDADEMEAPLLA